MRKDNYIYIPCVFITELGLKGLDLLITSIIYNYSRNGQGMFFGTTEYLSECTGASISMVQKTLKKLTEKGYLVRGIKGKYGAKTKYCYKFNNELESTLFDCDGISEGRGDGISEGRGDGISEGRGDGISEGRVNKEYNKDIENIDVEIISEEESENNKQAAHALLPDNPPYSDFGLTPEILGISKAKLKTIENKMRRIVFYDTTDKELIRMFYVLATTKSWNDVTLSTLQKRISSCSKYPNGYVKYRGEMTLANNWKCVIYPDMDKDYNEWCKKNNISNDTGKRYTEEEIWKMFNE